MNRISKALVGVALSAGVAVGSAGVAWASDPLIDTNPCEGAGIGAEVYVDGRWIYACVYP